jgi:CheY-like chemotaxis protein
MSSTRVSEKLERVKVIVQDTGIGIPQDRLSDIFGRFTQVDSSTSRRYGGTGLGLAICKNLVHLMKGEMQVKSVEDEGSQFSFEVPLLINDDLITGSMPVVQPPQRACLIHSTPQVEALLSKEMKACGVNVECYQEDVNYDVFIIDIHNMKLGDQSNDLMDFVRAHVPEDKTMIVLGDYEVYSSIEDAFPNCIGYLRRPLFKRKQLNEVLTALCLGKEAVQFSHEEALYADGESEHALSIATVEDSDDERYDEWKGKTFLLVDDDPIGLLVLETMIKEKGMEYKTATDGIQALELAKHEAFDVVFLDCMMPKLDGYATSMAMNKLGAQRPRVVVALTANASTSDREKCINAGMDDYLTKPLSDQKLKAILDKWV